MICYRLRCEADHGFEGWFRSGDDFDRQSASGLIGCPQCGSLAVTRALMAPAVVGSSKRRGAPAASEPQADAPAPDRTSPAPGPVADAGGEIPAALRGLLTRMRQEIERTCENVGADFADQAIRMHRGDIAKRGIYGETTPVEREVLAEEGVEVARIPWVKRADS